MPCLLVPTGRVTDSGTPDNSPDSPDTGREIKPRLERMRSRTAGERKRPSRAKGVKAAAGEAEPVAAAVAETPVAETPMAETPVAEAPVTLAPEAELVSPPEPAPTPTPVPVAAMAPTPVSTTAAFPARNKPKGERRVEVRMSGSRSNNKERQVRREFIMALVATVAAFGVIWLATGALGS